MKLEIPKGKAISDHAITAGAVIAGMKASKGVKAISPIKNETANKLAIAALGVAMATSIKGTGVAASAARGAGIGMVAQQVSDAIDYAVAPKLTTSSPFVQAAFSSNAMPMVEAKPALAGYRRRKTLGSALNPQWKMGMPQQGSRAIDASKFSLR